MCGIAGILYKNGQETAKRLLSQMLTLQHHRGPDNTGMYLDDAIVLGHNRLSLLDLSTNGDQPFRNDRFVLVYNGEIYNFKALKEKLPPREYVSTSDTEVLFWALQTWGVSKTISQLEGMFAFSWWDIQKKELYLVRDKLGIKPLFYGTCKSGNFVFASELKSLVKPFSFDPDPIKVSYAALGILEKSRDYTAWHNLHHLPPGYFLRVTQNEVQLERYFNLLDLVDESRYQSLHKATSEDVANELEVLLASSVQRMLVSDAPMGCFVSGGIDSSLIGALARKEKHDIQFFTANVVGRYSEFSDAQLLSTQLQTPLHAYTFEKEFAFRDITRVTWHYETPIINHFNAIAFSNVSGLARQNTVKAVLTGEGADELFLGYPKLLTQRYDNLIKAPFTIINSLYSLFPPLRAYTNKTQRSEGLLSVLEMTAQDFTRQNLREEGLQKYHFIAKAEEREQQYLSAQMVQEGLVSLLWRNDRMGMIHSIESRFPFLDDNILAFALNLPSKHKIGRIPRFYNYKHPFLIDKKPIRQVGQRYLNTDLTYKKKFGFATYDFLSIKVHPSFFDNGVIAEVFKMKNKSIRTLSATANSYQLGLLAAVEIWAQLFINNSSIEDVELQVKKHFSFK